jgi:ATP-dependent DNA helicase RecG
MSLPINIQELLQGRIVEWERLEFKEGWNPERVLHTICAFANDINNWGGGYIIIGIAEKNGLPVLPPVGINRSEIVKIQKELLNLCHKIKPNYFPISEVTQFMGKDILILWVYSGQHRPYKVPVNLTNKSEYVYYVRHFSSTKKANYTEERELISLSNNIPFDDKINYTKSLKDISVSLIQEYLNEIGSDLSNEALKMPFVDLCLRMNIVNGPVEQLKPKNIGLLLFNEHPEKIFPGAHIDVVEFDDDVGDSFSEKFFSGPIHRQVKEALSYLKNKVIKEFVRKIPGKAEAERFFNYPYEALEEIVVNAVYHRGYDDREPIEIRTYPERIIIVSYPGPMPPLNNSNLNKPVVIPRRYRNSRLGDFLKELHLTEGRSTGFPKIKRALKKNGSPVPIFETDDDREYFMTTINIHPKAKEKAQAETQVGTKSRPSQHQVNEQTVLRPSQDSPKIVPSEEAIKILKSTVEPKGLLELMEICGKANRTRFRNLYLRPLIDDSLIELTIPNLPRHREQKYKITEKGLIFLKEK